MTAPKNARDIFLAALDQTPGDRAAYLDEVCGDDPALRQRVDALLRANDDPGAFLSEANRGAGEDDLGATGAHTPRPDEARQRCTTDYRSEVEPGLVVASRYTLQEKIGEGGMGEGWVAKQTEPVKRKVALKLIKAGMDTKAVLQRFEAERQALALMDHPNIAKVLDGGMTAERRPFFVMELVNGLPLTRFCDEAKLSIRERLELFVSICQAAQHAHQKGIIHRDLKPSNILVTVLDGKPIPKIIDFGVAKAVGGRLTDESLSTQFGAVVGTLEYMSPEQAGYSAADVDTRSDIYSLGIILYELLTGLKPIDTNRLRKAAMTEMIRIIREEEPSKPSTRLSTDASAPSLAALRHTEPKKLAALLRGELDCVVMKCLEKQRDRRYETANGLARDIQRYLTDELVEARPPSAGYRLRKFARKHRAALASATAIAVLLMVGFGVSLWQMSRAIAAEGQAKQNAEQARDEANAKELALKAERQAREDETKARQQAIAAEGRAKQNAQQARDEANAKELALKAERQARADETKARQQAFAALRSMANDVVERKFTQGAVLTEDDRAFLRGVIAQYDAFAAIKGADADSRAARAEGRIRVGLMRYRLGEFKEAEQDYDQALSIYKQLDAEFPSQTDYRERLARVYSDRSNLLLEAGRLKEAEKSCDQALSIQKQLAADFPAQPRHREALAIVHNSRGNALLATGQLQEAEQDYDQALSINKQLAADFPSRPEFRHALASSHHNRGFVRRDIGRLKEAEQDYDQALSIRKQLAVDYPTRSDFRHDLAKDHGNRGNLLIVTGRIQGAEEDFDEALRISKQLAADFPSRPEFRHDLAQSHINRGNLLDHTGRPREAEQDFNHAVTILKQLAADFPSQPDFRRDLAKAYGNRGLLLAATGRLMEAEQDLDRDLGIYKQLAADFPARPDLRNDLAGTCVNVAILQLRQGNLAAAKRLLLEGRPHHLAALKANPRHPIYRQFYRNHLGLLTTVHAGLLEPEDAVRTAETVRDLGWNAPADAYDAACFLSHCAPIVAKHDKLDGTQRKEAAQFYGDAAMKLLREAVSKGWTKVAHMKKDADLDPLRQREDFQKLIANLEAKKPEKQP